MSATIALPGSPSGPRPAPPAKAPALVRASFFVAGTIAPDLSARFVAGRMFRPRRPVRAAAAAAAGAPRVGRMSLAGRQIATYQWGAAGPTALLVHGWEGCAFDFAPLIAPLQSAGWRLLAFDAPAHGSSDGVGTDVGEIAQVIGELLARVGPPQAIVTHSVGAAAAVLYLAEQSGGAMPRRLVLLAPGGDLEEEIARIAGSLGLPARAGRRLRGLVERRYGRPVAECSVGRSLAGCPVPTLMVHDELDPVVPIGEAERIAARAPHARLVRTRGLGHRRLLKDASVIREVAAFLAPAQAAA